MEFDVSRARLKKKDDFKPFNVKSTQSLQDALLNAEVKDDTALLVLEHQQGVLALLRNQMSYHHVAQGEIAGKPWLVTF